MRTVNGIFSNVDNVIWCPLGCGQGQVHYPGETQPWAFCPNDRDYFCVRHRVAWHHGFTCEAFDAMTNRQRFHPEVPTQTQSQNLHAPTASSSTPYLESTSEQKQQQEKTAQRRARLAAEEAATNQITRLCGRCPRRIMKDGGCNQMRCACGHYFIWDRLG
ncbi:hypothetical protein F4811DRAFT_552847 [Daldinia bambusicola]|nr:hypothetical protein F4811DRAFT_552847 [Daldinia bambusicola]